MSKTVQQTCCNIQVQPQQNKEEKEMSVSSLFRKLHPILYFYTRQHVLPLLSLWKFRKNIGLNWNSASSKLPKLADICSLLEQ